MAVARNRRRRPGQREPLAPPSWKWRTLPVWLALWGGMSIGWYIAAIGSSYQVEPWAYYVLLGIIALFSLGLSVVVNRYTYTWVAKRRASRQEKRILKDPASRR